MSQPQEPAKQPEVPDLGNFRLGDWSVCQTEGTLSSNGRSVRLEPRVMDVLIYLAAEPGRVVSKEELLEAVWGGAFVEEGVLSQAIHSLRKALGDDARQPRYVQTIPKRGYRLVALVVPEEHEARQPEPVKAWQEKSGEVALAVDVAAPALFRRHHWTWLLLVAGLVIAMAVIWFAWDRRSALREEPGDATSAESPGIRIVVLPFESLGKSEDAFFADGLTEEITKDLASFPSLQVVSRTSALRYKGIRKSLPEIGRELRVDYVLEGTVRWAAGADGKPRVRITPQLIRVADDAHVWAEAFDREVEDIFEVQAEISRRVIGRLGITLIPEERRALRRPSTQDLEAYRAYLRGLELKNQPFYSEEHLRLAVPMFERAVGLDPRFAVAWAELSQTHSYLAFNGDRSTGRVERARNALDRAEALAPDLREVRLARAYFTYRCLNDFGAAHEQLAAAARLYPNDPEVLQSLGFVLRRRGRLQEAIQALQDSFSLDPQTVKLVWAIAETYRALRDYKQADRYYEHAISMAPDQSYYWEERALNRVAWTGDVKAARDILKESPISDHAGLLPVAFQLDLYDRHYDEALGRLVPGQIKRLPLLEQSRLAILEMIARERLGDSRGALAAADAARADLEVKVARFPREAFYRAYLAMTLAQSGRRTEALGQVEKAVLQKRNDAFTGPRIVEIQAQVDTLLGRRREAIAHLDRLLSRPYQSSLTLADLRLNPVWDPLREEPGFEKLLQRYDN